MTKEEKTKQREREDFNWTLLIGVMVLPLLAIIENHLPVSMAEDWPMVREIIFGILGALGISVVSAKATGARHRRNTE